MNSKLKRDLVWFFNNMAVIKDECSEKVKSWIDQVQNDVRLEKVDIYKLSREELIELGFAPWDKESGLLLAPYWMYEIIPDGSKLITILGDEITFKKGETDKDIRFGMLAYGVKVKEGDKDAK